MSIIDRVNARWKEIAAEPVALVPEWPDADGNPTVIYAEPWTVRDHERFLKVHGEEKDWAAEIVISKARDEAGAPLFDKKDIIELTKLAERHVIVRIAHCITFSMTMEDAKKKLTQSAETITQSE